MRKYVIMLAAVLACVLTGGAAAYSQDTTTMPTEPGLADAPGGTAPAEPAPADTTEETQDSDFILTEAGSAIESQSVDGRARTSLRACQGSPRATNAEVSLMEKINTARVNRGNSRLCVDPRLMRSSQDWSNFMARNHVFYHGGLRFICDREQYCGYDAAYENIGYRGGKTPNPGAQFSGYMNSNEGHKEAMMGPNRDRMGTAFQSNNRGDYGFTFNTVHLTSHPNE